MPKQIHVHVHRTKDAEPALNRGEAFKVSQAVSKMKAAASSVPAYDESFDTRRADQYVDKLYEVISAAQAAIRIIGD